MAQTQPAQTAEVNIHLRARERDREIIDRAAELVGANRSQFMLASALNEAKRVLLDQPSVIADAQAFQKVLDWMDAEASEEEAAGLTRLLQAEAPWNVPRGGSGRKA
jgi:uncharacterized protein (DUF1778 family)